MISQVNEHLRIPTKHIVEWTRSFVRHPSPQTERFEHEPQVQSFIGERVVPLVQELGLPWRRDAMGNLLVELGPERADRSLMLMAYAMTHPANRMPNPYAGELIEDASGAYVRGRGVSEQKGSLAAALAAVKAAADRLALRGRLIFTVSTAGETGRHDAALSICDALGFTPRLAVIVIGTTSRVALANKGRIDAIITVRGKASHSSTPWVGVNAIDGARRVLDRVMAVDVGANKHPGLGQATLTPTAVRSWPEATHTVQDEVRLVFDRRLLPGDDPQAAITAVVRNARLTDLLKDCIAFTGDVDTVATIALAAGSCSAEYEQDLPASLLQGSENGAYGRDHLTAILAIPTGTQRRALDLLGVTPAA